MNWGDIVMTVLVGVAAAAIIREVYRAGWKK